jgi:hypothetical protein
LARFEPIELLAGPAVEGDDLEKRDWQKFGFFISI